MINHNKSKAILKFAISAAMLSGVLTAHAAELKQEELEAVNQYKAMQALPFNERKAFRQNLFGGMTESERDAFKLAVDKGLSFESQNHAAKSPLVRIPGTSITYDNGVSAGVAAGQNSFMQGNRFDSGFDGSDIENVEVSGSVTQVVFDMLSAGGSAAFFSVFSNITGTAAAPVTSVNIPAVAGLNTFTLATAVNYSNGPFLAGIWRFDAGSDAINVSTGTVNGQGFHGIEINDIAGTGYNPNLITSGGQELNAIMRVSGDVLEESVPIELIDFTIEKND